MDFTKENLETLASLRLHNVSVEQRVVADRKMGERFHFFNGVWWHRVKPFFYLPVSFLLPLRPHESPPNPWIALGGYYHVVPAESPSNGFIVTNEVSDPGKFQLEMLKQSKNGARKVREIERGLSVLAILRIVKLDDLLGDGYRVFRDWEQRTVGVWPKDIGRTSFRRWADRAFHHPYDLLLGAYFKDRLVAFALVKSTDGVANLMNTFGDRSIYKTLRISPTTVLNYAYIKICGQSPGIHKAINGLRSLKDSLEQYKTELGYRHVYYPAFICLRAPIRPLVRLLMPVQYCRLMGRYAAGTRDMKGQEA